LGDPALPSFCPNCGAPRDGDAAFCARCGRNFTEEFKGTPIDQIEDASEVFVRLRASIGDRYAIERELGKGGMATVYLARDIKHDREVAIKVLHPELSASIGADRFEREIRLAAKLQHPHILGLYDSGNADGLLYYVMPFVRGEALRDRLDREGMLPVEDALRITLEVCSALHYAHEQGIVHRDIKPENILLSGEHSLVADFGIARAANDASGQKLTQTGMAVGTPVYMAPEQSTGDPVGPTADIYSLGCMLYEMLAGEPPFTGPNAMAIMAKHLMEQVPSVRVLRNTVPVEVEEAIFHALAKAAVDRPKTAQAFGEMLGANLRDSGGRRAIRPTSANRASMAVPRGSQMVRGSQMIPRQTISGQAPVFMLDEAGELVEIEQKPWWKRPAMLLVAGLVVALGGTAAYFGLNQPKAAGATDPTLRRVAVLYFDSPDSTLRPAADGITEGLIRSLSRVSQITTISQAGSESVRNLTSTDSIVDALRVGFLVRGSLRPEGERIAISYRLENRNGRAVGDQSLTVAKDSILLVQDSIAQLAAELIRRGLGEEIQLQTQQAATASNVAWLAVQDGLALQRRASAAIAAGDAAGAVALFDRADSAFAAAEEEDPRWVEPIVRRATLAYVRSRTYGRNTTLIRPWVELSIRHADRAIAMAPDDADALEARGTTRVFAHFQSVTAEQDKPAELAKAIADLTKATTSNKAQAGAWASLSAALYVDPKAALSEVTTAAQMSLAADEFQSNAIITRGRLVNAAYDNGSFDQADRACADLEARHPGNARSIRCRLYLQSIPGLPAYDIARAWRLADSLVAAMPADTVSARHIGQIFAAATIARASKFPGAPAGLADSARAVARRGEGDAIVDQTGEFKMFAAYVATILDDRDDIYRRLSAYIAVSPTDRREDLRTKATWWFKPLEPDPRWSALVGRAR
jgi:eukaryotic-like serine/threonine-protein kinase